MRDVLIPAFDHTPYTYATGVSMLLQVVVKLVIQCPGSLHVPVGVDVLVGELLPGVAQEDMDLFDRPSKYVREQHQTQSLHVPTDVFVDPRP